MPNKKDSKDKGKKAVADVPAGKPYLAKVYVSPKTTVNDPEGTTIASALGTLGFETVESVRSGRFFQVRFRAESAKKAEKLVSQACGRLLANPVIETYTFDISEA